MSYETITTELDSGVLTLTLNRPDSYNACNEALTTELRKALRDAERSIDVRAILLTGAGKAFCSGQDLKEAPQPGEGSRRSLQDSLERRYNPIIRKMRTMAKPVITAINGVAAGAGCSLALAGDMRIISSKGYLLQAFINIGLVPDSGSTQFLVSTVGYARAFEIVTLGEKISAEEAHRLGLVNRVVEPDDLMSTAMDLARKYASGPTKAYGYIKKMLDRAEHTSLASNLEYEVYMQEAAGRTEDYREGVASFVEKRPAEFKGR